MLGGIRVISEAKELEEDKSWWKILLIFSINLTIFSFVVYFFKNFLISLKDFDFFLFFFGFLLFLSLSILEAFLIKSKAKIFVFTFLQSFFPLIFFIDEIQKTKISILQFLLLALILAFVFNFKGKNNGIKVLSESLNIRFFQTAKIILPQITAGFLIILFALTYFMFFEWKEVNFDFGKKISQGIAFLVIQGLKTTYPNLEFNPSQNLDSIIESIVINQLKSQKITDETTELKLTFNKLPEELKTKLINESKKQIEDSIKKSFNFFDSNQNLNDFVFSILKFYFDSLRLVLGSYFELILFIVFFFFIKKIFSIFYWFIKLNSFLIFKLLLAFSFAYITLETKTREFILLS